MNMSKRTVWLVLYNMGEEYLIASQKVWDTKEAAEADNEQHGWLKQFIKAIVPCEIEE